jgi:glutamyl-tRNA reductase
MPLIVVGLSHKTAPLEIREKLALDEAGQAKAYSQLKRHRHLNEMVFLSTCNRVEVYAWADSAADGWERLREFFSGLHAGPQEILQKALYQYEGDATLWHLLQVASSLDSMVLGEAQILGQVKSAYEMAVGQKVVGSRFHGIFHRVFKAAKDVRTRTDIGRFSASVSTVAVELASRLFNDLTTRSALLVGAGEMGRLTAEHLHGAGLKELTIANRSLGHADDLARKVQAKTVDLTGLSGALAEADVVICSTASPEALLTLPMVKAALTARRLAPMLLIDLSVPRNIHPDVDSLEQVYLYNIDDLQQLAGQHRDKRAAAGLQAEELLKRHQAEISTWMGSRRLTPAVAALTGKVEALRAAEWAKIKPKLAHLPKKDQERIEHLTRSLAAKILSTPLSRLKRSAGAEETLLRAQVQTLNELFGLEGEE